MAKITQIGASHDPGDEPEGWPAEPVLSPEWLAMNPHHRPIQAVPKSPEEATHEDDDEDGYVEEENQTSPGDTSVTDTTQTDSPKALNNPTGDAAKTVEKPEPIRSDQPVTITPTTSDRNNAKP